MFMFEIKAKDMRGRVGVLKTKHGNVKTPALMPVIHPRKQVIDVLKQMNSIPEVRRELDRRRK